MALDLSDRLADFLVDFRALPTRDEFLVGGDLGASNFRCGTTYGSRANLRTNDFHSLLDGIVAAVLDVCTEYALRPARFHLAIAGDVRNGAVVMTNAHSKEEITEAQLSNLLGTPVTFHNDLPAIAAEVKASDPEDFIMLSGEELLLDGTLGVFGLGTGNNAFVVNGVPMEFGHIGWQPRLPDEWELLDKLQVRAGGAYVTIEDVLSGDRGFENCAKGLGLRSLYQHLQLKGNREVTDDMSLPGPKKVAELMSGLIGYVARTLIVQFRLNALVLNGSVVNALRPVLRQPGSPFQQNLLVPGRAYQSAPVAIHSSSDLGMHGALRLARAAMAA